MDSGWIVAGSSLATIIVTGLFSVWSKRIDAKQKVNEHKLVIRSAYVNKKIEAGQVCISKLNVIMNALHLEKNVLLQLKISGSVEQSLDESSKSAKEKIATLSLITDDSADAFFDLEGVLISSNSTIQRTTKGRNMLNKFLSNGDLPQKELAMKEVDELISIHNDALDLCRTMVKSIRDELSKYDIV